MITIAIAIAIDIDIDIDIAIDIDIDIDIARSKEDHIHYVLVRALCGGNAVLYLRPGEVDVDIAVFVFYRTQLDSTRANHSSPWRCDVVERLET